MNSTGLPILVNVLLPALLTFALVYGGLRLLEYGYHTWRGTADWSPHWGTWLFALLVAIYMVVNELGRSA